MEKSGTGSKKINERDEEQEEKKSKEIKIRLSYLRMTSEGSTYFLKPLKSFEGYGKVNF